MVYTEHKFQGEDALALQRYPSIGGKKTCTYIRARGVTYDDVYRVKTLSQRLVKTVHDEESDTRQEEVILRRKLTQ